MFDWLKTFVEPTFMPHGHCYLWRRDILWMHVGADFIIAAAYYAIPIVLGIFLAKRKENIPHPEIIGLFCAFIFLCGTTHIFGIAVTWYPLYELQGWLMALTALVSIYTAAMLIPMLPELLAYPDVKKAYQNSQEAMAALQERNDHLQTFYDASIDREARIMVLKEEVNQLLAEQDKPPRYYLQSGNDNLELVNR